MASTSSTTRKIGSKTRATTARSTKSTHKPKPVDELANQLASGLAISDTKGKQKETAIGVEKCRLEAMRIVNTAIQSLSTLVKNGWMATKGDPPGKKSSVATSAASAANSLKVLREMCHGDLDVERAALSIVGKLVTLGMVSISFPTELISHHHPV